jgi:hypothetical protein
MTKDGMMVKTKEMKCDCHYAEFETGQERFKPSPNRLIFQLAVGNPKWLGRGAYIPRKGELS